MNKKIEECHTYRAVKLVFDYYKYFMNCDKAKIFGGVNVDYKYITKPTTYISNYWDHTKGQYVQTPVTYNITVKDLTQEPEISIWFYNYKSKKKAAEVERLRQLLLLSPDMELEENGNKWHYKVKYVNLSLPSIKDNALGFERKIDDNQES